MSRPSHSQGESTGPLAAASPCAQALADGEPCSPTSRDVPSVPTGTRGYEPGGPSQGTVPQLRASSRGTRRSFHSGPLFLLTAALPTRSPENTASGSMLPPKQRARLRCLWFTCSPALPLYPPFLAEGKMGSWGRNRAGAAPQTHRNHGPTGRGAAQEAHTHLTESAQQPPPNPLHRRGPERARSRPGGTQRGPEPRLPTPRKPLSWRF